MLINPTGDEDIEIKNGDFSDGSTDWLPTDGWTIAGGKAIFADVFSPGDLTQLDLGMIPGNSYTLEFDISDYTDLGGLPVNIIFLLGDSVSAEFTSNGHKTGTLTFSSGPDILRFQVLTDNPGEGLKIDNITITPKGDFVSNVLEIHTMTPKAIHFQPLSGNRTMHNVYAYKDKTNLIVIVENP